MQSRNDECLPHNDYAYAELARSLGSSLTQEQSDGTENVTNTSHNNALNEVGVPMPQYLPATTADYATKKGEIARCLHQLTVAVTRRVRTLELGVQYASATLQDGQRTTRFVISLLMRGLEVWFGCALLCLLCSFYFILLLGDKYVPRFIFGFLSRFLYFLSMNVKVSDVLFIM